MFITGAVIVMLTAIAVHVKLKSVFSELIRSYQARRVEWPGQNKKRPNLKFSLECCSVFKCALLRMLRPCDAGRFSPFSLFCLLEAYIKSRLQ